MFRRIALLIALVMFTLLGACGQKGPLYLPDDQDATAEAAADVQRN
jgi:predicted small lipoprotein YifL